MRASLTTTIRTADRVLTAVSTAFAVPVSALLVPPRPSRGRRRQPAVDAALVLLTEAGLNHREAAAALDRSAACHVSRARRRVARLMTEPLFAAAYHTARHLCSHTVTLMPAPLRLRNSNPV